MLRAPSLQLSTLKALLLKEGIPSRVLNLNLAWMSTLHEAGFPLADYVSVSGAAMGPGDWAFSLPPFMPASPESIEAYRETVGTKFDEEFFDMVLGMRDLVPIFVERCRETILSLAPRVVGFTSTFQQNVPSLLLAKCLKLDAPELITVFGGANCDGPMGAALHRSFDFIDVVVRGEGEPVVGQLFSELLTAQPLTAQPGLCFRRDGERIEVPPGGSLTPMDEVSTPDHEEYFAEIHEMPFADQIETYWLPFESARGCWWGQKQHCTFCGLNGTSMGFRSKSPERVVDELLESAKKYGVTHFNSSDNIIDMGYFDAVLPKIADAGYGLHIFYETKSNIGRKHLAAMAAAGVHEVQPGIESLSTPILKLMKKGTSLLQNVRMLKWGLEHRIMIQWNLLYGFPNEDPEEYRKMADLVPSLVHLKPPSMNAIDVQRFSPYHSQPESFDIELRGARPFYRHLYPLRGQDLDDVAYSFEFYYLRGPHPETYIQPLRDRVDKWREGSLTSLNTLQYRHGPGFLQIDDGRGDERRRHRLGSVAAAAYLAMDAGATPKAIHAALQAAGEASSPAEIDSTLEEMLDLRLVLEDDGRFLALALPARPPR